MDLKKQEILLIQEKNAFEFINLGKFSEAEKTFRSLIKLDNKNYEYHNSLANVLKEQGKFSEAIFFYKKALEINTNNPEVYINYATALKSLNELDKGVQLIKRAISLNPSKEIKLVAFNNLGNIFRQKRDSFNAFENYKNALKIDSNYLLTLYNIALLYEDIRDYSSALRFHREIINSHKNFSYSLGKILALERHICDWSNFDKIKKIDKKNIVNLYKLNPRDSFYLFDDPKLDLKIATCFCHDNFKRKTKKPKLNRKSKIRIGYFSADFRYHPVAILISKVLELHNRDEFEIFAYSFGYFDDDIYTKKIKRVVDQFREVNQLSDEELLKTVRNDDIDLAIDLMGHTEFSRTSIFSLRVAPVQINYLGFSGSMGAEFIDFIIADKELIHQDERDLYTEKILYLEKCALCFDDTLKRKNQEFTRGEKVVSNHKFTFVCFNNNYKIGPEEFDIWMNLLKRVEDSCLWLKASNESAKNNLINEAFKRGISDKRLIFAEYTDFENHLKRHSNADLFLDTFNYNSGSTAVISLLSGLPLLTLKGKSYHSRMASSLLKSINLDELIANSKNEYEEKAYQLATYPEKLMQIKLKLKSNLKESNFFSSSSFTKELELTYKKAYYLNT